ncbi:hypothetical protein FMGBMHLM_3384 [Methylobacterium aerolatum]|nr:hypothetical protein FMGBMHLM_3384 [Methylobacterium aerolatum]
MQDDNTKHLYCVADGAIAEVRMVGTEPQSVECPTCGQSDTFKDAVASALGDQFGSMLGGAFAGSKTIKVTKSAPQGRWRLA